MSGTANASKDEVKKIDAVAREIQVLQQQLNSANEKVRMLYKNKHMFKCLLDKPKSVILSL
jgi:aspartyl/asparaginyl beta-hydroxylase (cupin superfamily)